MFTPSPARSITAVPTDTNASAPLLNFNPTSPPISVSPHPPDVLLAASHGLASILAHMSANHGLALNVVEAVYTRVGSLREADEVLMGMRKAAEGFGEREIERKTRGRYKEPRGSGDAHEGKHGVGQGRRGDRDRKEQKRTVLRYVAASEDGEGSEYSPPWTSRAAMWKHQSESASYVEEEEEEEDEEEEEGRVVEEQLLEDRAGESDNENGLANGYHDFSQVFMKDMRAREVERRIGRTKLHREIVKKFS
ncbi:hypothetical protein J3R82DRAFT_5208 [Butyriboletus roseoflavus]|nr:hypothetical protein J3R82DRAFT_5208 [Butyriboletus roseoflavus]